MRCTAVTCNGKRCKLTSSNSHDKCHIHSDDCPVCLTNLACNDDICKLRCGHLFHSSCVFKWNNHDCRCPCCRAAVLTPRRIEVYHHGSYDSYNLNRATIHAYATTSMLDICVTNKVKMIWNDNDIDIYDMLTNRFIENLDIKIFT